MSDNLYYNIYSKSERTKRFQSCPRLSSWLWLFGSSPIFSWLLCWPLFQAFHFPCLQFTKILLLHVDSTISCTKHIVGDILFLLRLQGKNNVIISEYSPRSSGENQVPKSKASYIDWRLETKICAVCSVCFQRRVRMLAEHHRRVVAPGMSVGLDESELWWNTQQVILQPLLFFTEKSESNALSKVHTFRPFGCFKDSL